MKPTMIRNLARGLSRRHFISALGATAATGAIFLHEFATADSPVLYYDSFGNVVNAAQDLVALGVLPPPIPYQLPGSPQSPDAARGHHDSSHAGPESERRMAPMDEGQSCPAGTTFVTSTYNQPNILMIMVDQLRYPRWLPNTGGQSAVDGILPSIAQLRKHSVVFPNYYVCAAACSPSRATLLTGLYSQQTCMFKTISPNVNGEPRLQSGPSGFMTFANALSQALPIGCGGSQLSTPYSVYWVGKWHVSDPAPSSQGPGANGPSDYGFIAYNAVNAPVGYPASKTDPSPDGLGNESTEGYNDNGNPNPLTPSPPYLSPTTFPVYDDAKICDFFINYTLPSLPTASRWCATVSFINPHDITCFPYTYGITTPSGPFENPCLTNLNSYGPICSVFPTNSYEHFIGAYPPPDTAGTSTPLDPDTYLKSLAFASLYTSAPSGWNLSDAPAGYLGGMGKPDVQQAFQQDIEIKYGTVTTTSGWITFLNYYLWMQTWVDAQVGRVLNALYQPSGTGPFWNNTVIVFTSDHGEYGGSHGLRAKGGALYDECLNVPLYISYPGMRTNWGVKNDDTSVLRPYLCSSVDILPFLYATALGNESWRNAGDVFSYLSNRESIFDFLFAPTPVQRRLTTIQNSASTAALPYVLHTTDEFTTANIFNPDGSITNVPACHAIAFRTSDITTSSNKQPPYGGAKLGVYSGWDGNSTTPSQTVPQQFEFYNYTAGNIAETGNSYSGGAGLAGTYKTQYHNLVPTELYPIDPKFSAAYQAALALYQQYYNANPSAGTSPEV